MQLADVDNKSIKRMIAKDSREYWLPIVTGYMTKKLCDYMEKKGFYYLNFPIINPSITQKDINISFDYKNEKLELSSSNALKLGAASALYNKVFASMSSVRNESEDDSVHLLEFKLLEAEWKSESYEELLCFIEDLLCYAINSFNDFIEEKDLYSIFTKMQVVNKVKRVPYSELVDILVNENVPVVAEELGVFYDYAITKVIKEPIIVMFYPPKGSWRAKRKSENEGYIFNLILPNGYGELIECSVRETNVDIIKNKFICAGIEEKNKWYIDALEYDSSERVGFGLGIERLCGWLTNSNDISTLQLFFRRPIV